MGMNQPSECFVSVDVETAGPIPGYHSLLSLGACVVGEPEKHFYSEFKPQTPHFIPEAVAVTGLDLAKLEATGEEPAVALRRFRDWAQALADNSPLVFVGFNAAFDWSFVNYHFHTHLGVNPFGFAPLDIKSYYMGQAGCSWGETKSSKLPTEFHVEPSAKHNALSDAVAQAETFARMMRANRRHRPQ